MSVPIREPSSRHERDNRHARIKNTTRVERRNGRALFVRSKSSKPKNDTQGTLLCDVSQVSRPAPTFLDVPGPQLHSNPVPIPRLSSEIQLSLPERYHFEEHGTTPRSRNANDAGKRVRFNTIEAHAVTPATSSRQRNPRTNILRNRRNKDSSTKLREGKKDDENSDEQSSSERGAFNKYHQGKERTTKPNNRDWQGFEWHHFPATDARFINNGQKTWDLEAEDN